MSLEETVRRILVRSTGKEYVPDAKTIKGRQALNEDGTSNVSPYAQGFRAFDKKTPVEKNPFEKGSKDASAWERGWKRSEELKQDEPGVDETPASDDAATAEAVTEAKKTDVEKKDDSSKESEEKKETPVAKPKESTGKDETYNGWKNRDTWNVALWLGNEESIYRLWLDQLKTFRKSNKNNKLDVKFVAQEMKTWFIDSDNFANPDDANFKKVDWMEIAKSFCEEHEDVTGDDTSTPTDMPPSPPVGDVEAEIEHPDLPAAGEKKDDEKKKKDDKGMVESFSPEDKKGILGWINDLKTVVENDNEKDAKAIAANILKAISKGSVNEDKMCEACKKCPCECKPMNEATSKKDYIAIAAIIKDASDIKDVADKLAAYFTKDNSQFDQKRFLQACGIDSNVEESIDTNTMNESFTKAYMNVPNESAMKPVRKVIRKRVV